MPESKQLHFLERLEAEKSDVQAAQLAKARQALAAAEAQLAQLRVYENGYHDQLSGRLEHTIAIDALRGHHRFMQNVAHAVRAQELEVARRRANADAVQRIWQEIERRRQAFRTMAERAAVVARRGEERTLQKTNDEFSTRRMARSDIGHY